jgi:hypothetical protein
MYRSEREKIGLHTVQLEPRLRLGVVAHIAKEVVNVQVEVVIGGRDDAISCTLALPKKSDHPSPL